MTIELEARYQRGRGSVDEYLEQTAIANPHVTLHYIDPGRATSDDYYARRPISCRREPKEIKPHPYGVELGRLVTMLKDAKAPTLSQFLTSVVFARQPGRGRRICETAKLEHAGQHRARSAAHEADTLFQAIQQTKIGAPATDCISPIGEELIAQGLAPRRAGRVLRRRHAAAGRLSRQSVPDRSRRWPTAARRPRNRVPLEALAELLAESDARTLRQFLITRFTAWAAEAADKILEEAELGTRHSPGKLKTADIAKLHEAMRSVNLEDGQTMNVLRYANRVPLQFQPAACAITQIDDGHQLAGLRAEPIARLAAQRPGDDHGPHGQRVGAVHQRIEGSDRRLSGDSKGAAAGAASGRPQAGHVPAPAAEA